MAQFSDCLSPQVHRIFHLALNQVNPTSSLFSDGKEELALPS